jgi:hypothetical protein
MVGIVVGTPKVVPHETVHRSNWAHNNGTKQSFMVTQKDPVSLVPDDIQR